MARALSANKAQTVPHGRSVGGLTIWRHDGGFQRGRGITHKSLGAGLSRQGWHTRRLLCLCATQLSVMNGSNSVSYYLLLCTLNYGETFKSISCIPRSTEASQCLQSRQVALRKALFYVLVHNEMAVQLRHPKGSTPASVARMLSKLGFEYYCKILFHYFTHHLTR